MPNHDLKANIPMSKATSRVVRYVYHVHGHAKLHHPNPPEHSHSDDPRLRVHAVPFEVVIRLPQAIDSDQAMEEVRKTVRDHIVDHMKASDSPYLVGDMMIRGLSHLHTILVEEKDPDGPAVRVVQ